MNNVDQFDPTPTAQRLRLRCLDLIATAEFGFIGSCFSAADIVAGVLNEAQQGAELDLIFSKGHAAPLLYAFHEELGNRAESNSTYASTESVYQGHPNALLWRPAILSSGSLGLGIASAVGLAIGRLQSGSRRRVFVLVGDGELHAGICWEALLLAQRLVEAPLFTLVVDANGFCSNGHVPDSQNLLSALQGIFPGIHIIEGHKREAIKSAIHAQLNSSGVGALWCNTRRGMGFPGYVESSPMSQLPSLFEQNACRQYLQAVPK